MELPKFHCPISKTITSLDILQEVNLRNVKVKSNKVPHLYHELLGMIKYPDELDI
jgi:hypothetical protein